MCEQKREKKWREQMAQHFAEKAIRAARDQRCGEIEGELFGGGDAENGAGEGTSG